MAPSTAATKASVKLESILSTPTEMSVEEYQDLLQQIRTELSRDDALVELLDAARYNEIDIVRGVLHCHADLINETGANNGGNTALHMAAANGHVEIVKVLLVAGSDAQLVNQAGNTPLHWAATNGQKEVVQVLVSQANADVLLRNSFGRSALTEGFTSQNDEVVKSLLEHESASEERLLDTGAGRTPGSSENASSGEADSVTHKLLLGQHQKIPVSIQVRELAIAKNAEDSILGQESPDQDTTGWGIWAASLVCAQWMVEEFSSDSAADRVGESSTTVAPKQLMELGAGCGVPGLAVARLLDDSSSSTISAQYTMHLTDFNERTVENLKHNIQLNFMECICEDDQQQQKVQARVMNWQDPSTWPEERMDALIGSDLIYQADMVPLLVQTVTGLLATGGVLYYVAPVSGRQGQQDFFDAMETDFDLACATDAPAHYSSTNPLESQDDEECFLHFHELTSAKFKLYKFCRKPSVQ